MNKTNAIGMITAASIIGMIAFKVFTTKMPARDAKVVETESVTNEFPHSNPETKTVNEPDVNPDMVSSESRDNSVAVSQSPQYKKIISLIADRAFKIFLEEHGMPQAIFPFFSHDKYTVQSFGARTNMYEASNSDGSQQMLVFIDEGSTPGISAICNYLGINPENHRPENGLITFAQTTDTSGESNVLFSSKLVGGFAVTGVWTKFKNTHSQEEIQQFKSAMR